MFKREIQGILSESGSTFPVVVLTGPRQSGKTTLLKQVFRDHIYLSLESPETLSQLKLDPVGYLKDPKKKWIIDEAQRWPELFSYIQVFCDEAPKAGRFILSGSQNFLLSAKVAQTLAGRAVILELLPLTYLEYLSDPTSKLSDIWTYLYGGSYPRPYHEKLNIRLWIDSYIRTYIERDVRSLINVKDLSQFHLFLKLCAGQHGQLLNQNALAQACGISQPTVHSWLSLLETSYIIFRLPPFYKNYKKRLIKTPKLYFFDSAIVCQLLGVESPQHLESHSMRGFIFEGFVVTEMMKHFWVQGRRPPLYFWRDQSGTEIDVIVETQNGDLAVEIKSAQTLNTDFFNALEKWKTLTHNPLTPTALVYNGIPSNAPQIAGHSIHHWTTIRQHLSKF